MPFVLRQEGDTQNPIAPRLYGLGVTHGRNYYYRKNLQGTRTGFINILTEGARFDGDLECDGILKVFYAGFELPEFNSDGSRNWRFHPGKITARKAFKTITAAAGNVLTVPGHGLTPGDWTPIRFSKSGGATLPVGDYPVTSDARYFARALDANSMWVATEDTGEVGSLIAFSSAGANSPKVYASTGVGYDDPVQGAFTFFPEMLWRRLH
jgi:hypothetical protein